MARNAAFTLLLTVTLAIASAGCASHSRKRVARATAVPPPIPVGTVALINDAGHFVLIDNGMLSAPPTGATLKTYTNGVESGELQSTEVRRHPFLIADIRTGSPRKGDRVTYDPYHGAAPPAAVPAKTAETGRGPNTAPGQLAPAAQLPF